MYHLKPAEHIVKFHVVFLRIMPIITKTYTASLSIIKYYKIIATFRAGEMA